MFKLFRKSAIPSSRSLERRVNKIYKVRGRYTQYCEAVLDDIESFTKQMEDLNNDLRNAIKREQDMEDTLDETCSMYYGEDFDSDDDDYDDDEESDDEDEDEEDESDVDDEKSDDENPLLTFDMFNKLTEELPETPKAKSGNKRVRISNKKCSCKECACESENADEAKKDNEETTNKNDSSLLAKYLKGSDSISFSYLVGAMKDGKTFSEIQEHLSSLGLKKTSESGDEVTFDNNISILAKKDKVAIAEIDSKVPVIEHGDFHASIFNSLGLTLNKDVKPFTKGDSSSVSKVYFSLEGLIVQITVSQKTKHVVIALIAMNDDSMDKIIKEVK